MARWAKSPNGAAAIMAQTKRWRMAGSFLLVYNGAYCKTTPTPIETISAGQLNLLQNYEISGP
jgi:hypothetical protein